MVLSLGVTGVTKLCGWLRLGGLIMVIKSGLLKLWSNSAIECRQRSEIKAGDFYC